MPPEVVRAGIPFCRRQFDDSLKAGECIRDFAESTSPEELRRRLACTAAGESTRETQECVRTLSTRPYRDGTTILDTVAGTEAAEYGRSVVASAESLITPWEQGLTIPAPAVPEVVPAPVAVAPRRGRGRPPTVPLTDPLSSCMSRLPEDLGAKLTSGMPSVWRTSRTRVHVAKDQVAEICHQVRDAEAIEPRLSVLEDCLCPAPIPSVLQLVTGRSAIVEFE